MTCHSDGGELATPFTNCGPTCGACVYFTRGPRHTENGMGFCKRYLWFVRPHEDCDEAAAAVAHFHAKAAKKEA